MADPLADLVAMVQVTRQFLYLRSAHMPPATMYVVEPKVTGAPSNVYVIPTGDQGDRVLAIMEAAGRTPRTVGAYPTGAGTCGHALTAVYGLP